MAWSIAAMLASAAAAAPITVPIGTDVMLVTAEPLSSKTGVKGQIVRMAVSEPVAVGDVVVLPAGTDAVGQIVDSRAKGAMGMSGRLVVRPLYLQINGRTIRLAGRERAKGETDPGAVIGLILLSPGFTGRSAQIPAGTSVPAMVEREITLER